MDNKLEGTLSGVFSVSAKKKVRFSQGNLQYQACTDTWRFAEHQYDMVGMGYGLTDASNDCFVGGTVLNSDNREIGTTYNVWVSEGWIDLFGWGTGNSPTYSSDNKDHYSTFVDWGVNKISNGGNVASAWFTLSFEEWKYLLNGRPNASVKQGIACVNGINGLVLLPDNWILPVGYSFTSGFDKFIRPYRYMNTYTVSEWQVMENAGAVFLPAAGYRDGTSVSSVGTNGYYWSSTYYKGIFACNVSFNSGNLSPSSFSGCYSGYNVRLCSEL
ncbi:MAG: hypothetical protein IJ270_00945 [Paludibacteraceae bacterium]|nr:hypothetical protein [Paludibacteraceae bacterium]